MRADRALPPMPLEGLRRFASMGARGLILEGLGVAQAPLVQLRPPPHNPAGLVVLHRLAISDQYLGKGLAQMLMKFTEEVALRNNIFSIKVDTNFDNEPMLMIFAKFGYIYCGEVMFRGGVRRAYEKILKKL